MIFSSRSVSCVVEIGGAFPWGEASGQLADAFPGCLYGAPGGLARQGLELGEDLPDRIEVGRVRRQEEELGGSLADGAAGGPALVIAQIAHDGDVAGPERRSQELLEIGKEAFPSIGPSSSPMKTPRAGSSLP